VQGPGIKHGEKKSGNLGYKIEQTSKYKQTGGSWTFLDRQPIRSQPNRIHAQKGCDANKSAFEIPKTYFNGKANSSITLGSPLAGTVKKMILKNTPASPKI